ncbi:receptor-like protein Cf-9 homolog [Ipomoea triloba]|uniref:receptor-like protein Cf-9 homolog n=1 Tax=Ipomoea triloba TaxID=35885 RepID=UPI00125D6F61|nr:receptor-like protein Cf-9 homolog [Ipomoea triloba]
MQNLFDLYLFENNLFGLIPETIGNLHLLAYLDFQNNNFFGPIPQSTGNLTGLTDLLLSNNNLTGMLPPQIGNLLNLVVLDLSRNNFYGPIPQIFGNLTQLEVLRLSTNNFTDLHRNQFHGPIPTQFKVCNSLSRLSLYDNQLEGALPRSLINCKKLKVLDLGHNNLSGTFPMWLRVLPNLKVLSLRFNRLNGSIRNRRNKGYLFPQLRVFDLSHNGFTGELPTWFFKNFKAMANVDEDKSQMYLGLNNNGKYILSPFYYEDSLIVTVKGQERELVRVFSMFITIDLSNNKFEGHIPNGIADLLALRELNLSRNKFTGHIPTCLGNLSMLESLDLSLNQIGGVIPEQLARSTTLEVLNLSHNKLVGCIPQGPQFNTFEANSYQGNDGLKGKPLSQSCGDGVIPQLPAPKNFYKEDDLSFLSGCTIKVVAMGYGCGILFGSFMGSLMILTGKPEFIAMFIEEEAYKLAMKVKRRNQRQEEEETSYLCMSMKTPEVSKTSPAFSARKLVFDWCKTSWSDWFAKPVGLLVVWFAKPVPVETSKSTGFTNQWIYWF